MNGPNEQESKSLQLSGVLYSTLFSPFVSYEGNKVFWICPKSFVFFNLAQKKNRWFWDKERHGEGDDQATIFKNFFFFVTDIVNRA